VRTIALCVKCCKQFVFVFLEFGCNNEHDHSCPPDPEYDVSDCDDVDFQPITSSEPQLFTQSELNDLVRDLGLPKDCAEILGSRFQSKNLLSPGTSFSWNRNRD
jgi:hypothetical protein